jgi:hypothetical protein
VACGLRRYGRLRSGSPWSVGLLPRPGLFILMTLLFSPKTSEPEFFHPLPRRTLSFGPFQGAPLLFADSLYFTLLLGLNPGIAQPLLFLGRLCKGARGQCHRKENESKHYAS